MLATNGGFGRFHARRRLSGHDHIAVIGRTGNLVGMIDLAGSTFPDNRACIVCTHVWNGHPVLLFAHDIDGDIQFYCGEYSHVMTDALVLGLEEISGHLLTMQDIPTVRPGFCAERAEVGGQWSIRKA